MPYKPVEIEFITCVEAKHVSTKERFGVASVTFQLDVPRKHRGLLKCVNDDARVSERLDDLFADSLSVNEDQFYAEFLLDIGESVLADDFATLGVGEGEYVGAALAEWAGYVAAMYLRFLNAVTVPTLKRALYGDDTEGLL